MNKYSRIEFMVLFFGIAVSSQSTTVTGALYDGRDLLANPLQGLVTLFQDDGKSPLPVQDSIGPEQNQVLTGSEGKFTLTFTAPSSNVVVVKAESTEIQGMQPVSRAVDLSGGNAALSLYLSTSQISGRVTDQNGEPVFIDIWVMRNNNNDGETFQSYEIAGGRDFIPPVLPSGIKFGTDTDPLGFYAVPVRIPDAQFNLVFGVDRNNNSFMSKQVTLNLPANTNVIQDVQLERTEINQTVPPVFESVLDVIARRGCNLLGCHGSGTGGFHLSNMSNGRTIEQDFEQIMMRINLDNPLGSLILQKPGPPAGNHEGGELLASENDPDFQTLLNWILARAPGPSPVTSGIEDWEMYN